MLILVDKAYFEKENFVKEDIEWSEEACNEKCQSSYPGSPVNCAEYSKNLIKKYGYTSIHKKCTRLSFFKTKFTVNPAPRPSFCFSLK